MEQNEQQEDSNINQEIEQVEKPEHLLDDDEEEQPQKPESNQESGIIDKLFDKNDVPLTTYDNHPLNFDDSDENKMVIRGIDGIVGDSHNNLSDILIGSAKLGYRYWYKKE